MTLNITVHSRQSKQCKYVYAQVRLASTVQFRDYSCFDFSLTSQSIFNFFKFFFSFYFQFIVMAGSVCPTSNAGDIEFIFLYFNNFVSYFFLPFHSNGTFDIMFEIIIADVLFSWHAFFLFFHSLNIVVKQLFLFKIRL